MGCHVSKEDIKNPAAGSAVLKPSSVNNLKTQSSSEGVKTATAKGISTVLSYVFVNVLQKKSVLSKTLRFHIQTSSRKKLGRLSMNIVYYLLL